MSTNPSAARRAPSLALSRTQTIGLLAAFALFLVPFFFQFPDLSVPASRVLAIFFLAVVLWITEAIPLHATAAVIILLEVLLVSDSAALPLPADAKPIKYADFFHTLANPVMMLFLGGFFLADGASKFELDRNLARVMLKPFGTSPKMILLGLMGITAIFSMFMSNTATTATMMAVIIPVLAQAPAGDRFRAGLALSIPVAANIGGIGTPIGTPPNAIALGALAQKGIKIGFMQWTMMAVPFMILILLISWFILATMFRSSQKEIRLTIQSKFDKSLPAILFYIVFVVTIGLWFTEALHGLSSNVVGFFPVAALLATRVFTSKDLKNIDWHVLWLLAGGIALGVGVSKTGLDLWMVNLVAWNKLAPLALIALLAMMSLLMGTFMSHSATANLLVPIGISIASSDTVKINPALAAVFIAIGSSLAMALPISTPPNAIAMSTGAVRTRDMAISGIIIGLIGWALFVFVARGVWNLLCLTPK